MLVTLDFTENLKNNLMEQFINNLIFITILVIVFLVSAYFAVKTNKKIFLKVSLYVIGIMILYTFALIEYLLTLITE
jgi:hypothetical protein